MTNTREQADALLASRREVYGDRIDSNNRVALIWSGLLGFEVKPFQVPAMMAAYKLFRAQNAPDYSDNVDDVDGWMVMVREQVANDYPKGMIQARTVEEYLEKKHTVENIEPEVQSAHDSAVAEYEKLEAFANAYHGKTASQAARPTTRRSVRKRLALDQSEGQAMDVFQLRAQRGA